MRMWRNWQTRFLLSLINIFYILLKSPAQERVPGGVTLNWLCQILCSAFGCLSRLVNARMCIVPAILDEEHLSFSISGNPLIQLSHDSTQVKRLVVVQFFYFMHTLFVKKIRSHIEI